MATTRINRLNELGLSLQFITRVFFSPRRPFPVNKLNPAKALAICVLQCTECMEEYDVVMVYGGVRCSDGGVYGGVRCSAGVWRSTM